MDIISWKYITCWEGEGGEGREDWSWFTWLDVEGWGNWRRNWWLSVGLHFLWWNSDGFESLGQSERRPSSAHSSSAGSGCCHRSREHTAAHSASHGTHHKPGHQGHMASPLPVRGMKEYYLKGIEQSIVIVSASPKSKSCTGAFSYVSCWLGVTTLVSPMRLCSTVPMYIDYVSCIIVGILVTNTIRINDYSIISNKAVIV